MIFLHQLKVTVTPFNKTTAIVTDSPLRCRGGDLAGQISSTDFPEKEWRMGKGNPL